MVQPRKIISTIALLLLLVTASAARADQTQPAANDRLTFMSDSQHDTTEQAPSTSGLLLRTVGALLLIVGLIVAASWAMKRFAGARFGSPAEDAPQLAVLNSLALGDKRSLAVVRFGERTLLLGSTSHAVTLLAEENNASVSPQPRSVAEILEGENAADFAEELIAAADRINPSQEPAKGEWA
ncbi:MAG TPA: flagellar biosynthetic protein FliO [Pyrinomonadaceae bacterium]|nr:flagellar biosynthetic protein FliO [Pyrinomonadaceae bacterium]